MSQWNLVEINGVYVTYVISKRNGCICYGHCIFLDGLDVLNVLSQYLQSVLILKYNLKMIETNHTIVLI